MKLTVDMDEIVGLIHKYPSPNHEMISLDIKQYVSSTETIIREKELQLAADEKTIENVLHKLSTLREQLESCKKDLETKTKRLETESQKLKELQFEKNRITKERHALQVKRNDLQAAKISPKDEFILDLGEKKYKLYKELTRVRWNYERLTEATKGVVTNKKKYVHAFEFPNNLSTDKVTDLVWNEIWLSTQKEIDDADENKENL